METTDAIFQWPLSILVATALFAMAEAALQAGCSQKTPWERPQWSPGMDSGVTHGHPQPCSPQGHSLELLWVIPDRGSQALGRFWVLGIPGAVEGGTGWSLRTPKKVALDEFSDFGDLWEGERCHWRGLGTLGQWKVTLEGFWVLRTPKRVEGGIG